MEDDLNGKQAERKTSLYAIVFNLNLDVKIVLSLGL